MSTRCEIARLNPDNSLNAMYCHFDGYFTGVGSDLLGLCNTQEKVNKLFSFKNVTEGIDEIAKALEEAPAEAEENQDVLPSYASFEDFVAKFGSDICIEYLYVWIPKDIQNEHLKSLVPESADGIWYGCENSLEPAWCPVENAIAIDDLIASYGIADFLINHSVSCDVRKQLSGYWHANGKDKSIFIDEKSRDILKEMWSEWTDFVAAMK